MKYRLMHYTSPSLHYGYEKTQEPDICQPDQPMIGEKKNSWSYIHRFKMKYLRQLNEKITKQDKKVVGYDWDGCFTVASW